MSKRLQKQLLIGVVYILLFIFIGYGAYDIATPDATCYDGIQNQREEGVDCGVACGKSCDPIPQAPQIDSVKLLEVRPGDYDVLAELFNPNVIYGSGLVSYDIALYDASGVELARVPGTTYLMPAEHVSVVRTSIKTQTPAVRAEIILKDAEWQKVSAGGVSITFSLKRESYGRLARPGMTSEFEAVVFNDSDFDFEKVDVAVVLLDASDNVLGVNTTQIATFISRTERYFKVSWPVAIRGTVAKTRVQASTNVFENSNFIRRYGTQEKFQQYYGQ